MEEKEQKPLIVEIDEAKQEIVASINNALQTHKIPFYFLDMILTNIGTEIKTLANKELTLAKQKDEKQGEE